MPFEQIHLDQSFNQSRGIYDKYTYDPRWDIAAWKSSPAGLLLGNQTALQSIGGFAGYRDTFGMVSYLNAVSFYNQASGTHPPEHINLSVEKTLDTATGTNGTFTQALFTSSGTTGSDEYVFTRFTMRFHNAITITAPTHPIGLCGLSLKRDFAK